MLRVGQSCACQEHVSVHGSSPGAPMAVCQVDILSFAQEPSLTIPEAGTW